MFELEINGEVYQFNFGFGFLREINKTQKTTSNGLTKEVGFQMKVAGLVDGDVLDLLDVLFVANEGQTPRITKKALEAYIEDPKTDIDSLFTQVLDFLKTNNVTKKLALKAIELLEEQEKKNS
jgi:hypothetical protein